MARYTLADENKRLDEQYKNREISKTNYEKLKQLIADSKSISDYAENYPRNIQGRRAIKSKTVDFEKALANIDDFDPEDYTEAELIDIMNELGVNQETEKEFKDAVEKLAIKNMKERIADSDAEQMNRITESEYKRAKNLEESPVKKYLLGDYGGKDYIEGKTGKMVANAIASNLSRASDFAPPVNPVTAGISVFGSPVIDAIQEYANEDDVSKAKLLSGIVARGLMTGVGKGAKVGLAKNALGRLTGSALGSGSLAGKVVEKAVEKYPKLTEGAGQGLTRRFLSSDNNKTDEAIREATKEYESSIKNTIDKYKSRWEKAEQGDERYLYSIPNDTDSEILKEAYKKWRGER